MPQSSGRAQKPLRHSRPAFLGCLGFETLDGACRSGSSSAMSRKLGGGTGESGPRYPRHRRPLKKFPQGQHAGPRLQTRRRDRPCPDGPDGSQAPVFQAWSRRRRGLGVRGGACQASGRRRAVRRGFRHVARRVRVLSAAGAAISVSLTCARRGRPDRASRLAFTADDTVSTGAPGTGRGARRARATGCGRLRERGSRRRAARGA